MIRPGTADSRLESNGKRVMDVVEDYLETCAQVSVDVEVVESLLRPENLEVSLTNVLKHSTRRGSNIFQLFDTSEKPNHFVASRRRWLESHQERDGARQESGQNEWHDIEYLWQKPCRAPTEPYRRLCFSKVRRQPEKKKAAGS